MAVAWWHGLIQRSGDDVEVSESAMDGGSMEKSKVAQNIMTLQQAWDTLVGQVEQQVVASHAAEVMLLERSQVQSRLARQFFLGQSIP